MTALDARRSVPAIGIKKARAPNGMRKVVCLFDDQTFEEVRARALAEKTSFAEQVRCLVEWGLMEKNEVEP